MRHRGDNDCLSLSWEATSLPGAPASAAAIVGHRGRPRGLFALLRPPQLPPFFDRRVPSAESSELRPTPHPRPHAPLALRPFPESHCPHAAPAPPSAESARPSKEVLACHLPPTPHRPPRGRRVGILPWWRLQPTGYRPVVESRYTLFSPPTPTVVIARQRPPWMPLTTMRDRI